MTVNSEKATKDQGDTMKKGMEAWNNTCEQERETSKKVSEWQEVAKEEGDKGNFGIRDGAKHNSK